MSTSEEAIIGSRPKRGKDSSSEIKLIHPLSMLSTKFSLPLDGGLKVVNLRYIGDFCRAVASWKGG